MATYTVYTKPNCPHCVETKGYFERKGVGVREVDITEVPAAFEYITSDPADGGLGYSQAPVVVNDSDDEDHWSGHRMDKLIQAARKAA